jgi:hypothetical protein
LQTVGGARISTPAGGYEPQAILPEEDAETPLLAA